MKRQAYTFFICATKDLFEATSLVAKHLNVHEASAAQSVVVCRSRFGLIDQMWLAGLPLEMEANIHYNIVPPDVLKSIQDHKIRRIVSRLSRMYGEGIFFDEVPSLLKTRSSSGRRTRSRFTKRLKKPVPDLNF